MKYKPALACVCVHLSKSRKIRYPQNIFFKKIWKVKKRAYNTPERNTKTDSQNSVQNESKKTVSKTSYQKLKNSLKKLLFEK